MNIHGGGDDDPVGEGAADLPTVEVDIGLSDGSLGSTRDGGSDYLGKGVLKAVNNVNAIIGPALIGKDPTEQTDIDNFMVQQLDGTSNEWGWCKQKLGANAILAVCKAGAMVKKIPLYQHIANLAGNKTLVLPVPAFNVINGGSHAGNKLAMQEFMILPTGAASFKEAMKMGVEVYHHLKSIIKKKYGQDATNVGDEGGFAPNIQENKEGLELLKAAIAKAGYTGKVVIGMDVAASELYSEKDQTYDLNFKEDIPIRSAVSLLWDGYVKCGSFLSITHPTRVAKAISEKTCNALLLKVNQIGSVTESIEAVSMSKRAGWGVMASHRSGETEDTFIADLSVGLATPSAETELQILTLFTALGDTMVISFSACLLQGQIKTGAPCRSERLAKYNQVYIWAA
ncbi:hypothetical protein VPH35_068746 [Triticum aestivum]